MMRRRNFITGTVVTAAALALAAGGPADCVAAQPSLSALADDDTLVERTSKLNALMGTDYEVDVTYPKEWEGQRWGTSRDELLGAQFPRLVYNSKHPFEFEWSVHFKRNGKQCSHDMSPFEFFHWTSAAAWWYRHSKAGKQG